MQRRDKSTQQPMRPKVMQIARPSSAEMLHSPSPLPDCKKMSYLNVQDRIQGGDMHHKKIILV
jgi:hypothetical protein